MAKHYDLDVSLLGIERRGWRRLRTIREELPIDDENVHPPKTANG